MDNKFAVLTNTYHGFTLDEALSGIAAAGFQYVELAAVRGWTEHVSSDMSDAQIEEVKQKLSSLGLTAIGMSGHCNLMEEERLDDFRKNIVLASKLGCQYIISSTGEAHFGKGESFSDDVLAKHLKSLVPELEKHHMIMVLEVHGEYGTGESLYKVTRMVDSPYVAINYDTANVVFYGGKYPEEEIKCCVDDVKYVHLKDKAGEMKEWNFPGVGSGNLKLKEFMEYMDSKDYTGPYSIEIEYTEDFCMRDKKPEDLAVANKAVKDSYDYLKSIGRI